MVEDELKDDEHFTTINSSELVDDSVSKMSIEVPMELLRNLKQQGMVSVVSFIYYNVKKLFPKGLPSGGNK